MGFDGELRTKVRVVELTKHLSEALAWQTKGPQLFASMYDSFSTPAMHPLYSVCNNNHLVGLASIVVNLWKMSSRLQ